MYPAPTFHDRVGREIRRHRERHCYDQAQLAARTGLCDSVISRIEAGLRPVRLYEALRIADALGVCLCSLVPSP